MGFSAAGGSLRENPQRWCLRRHDLTAFGFDLSFVGAVGFSAAGGSLRENPQRWCLRRHDLTAFGSDFSFVGAVGFSAGGGSLRENPRPWRHTRHALTAFGSDFSFVGAVGFEPTTSWSRTKRSNRTEPRPAVFCNITQQTFMEKGHPPSRLGLRSRKISQSSINCQTGTSHKSRRLYYKERAYL